MNQRIRWIRGFVRLVKTDLLPMYRTRPAFALLINYYFVCPALAVLGLGLLYARFGEVSLLLIPVLFGIKMAVSWAFVIWQVTRSDKYGVQKISFVRAGAGILFMYCVTQFINMAIFCYAVVAEMIFNRRLVVWRSGH